jgi:hypothetical protein
MKDILVEQAVAYQMGYRHGAVADLLLHPKLFFWWGFHGRKFMLTL